MTIAKVPLESNIESYFRLQVLRAGGDIRKLTGRKNDPDRVVIWPGAYFGGLRSSGATTAAIHFVELKRPGKKPRAGQARRLKKLTDMGCTALYLDTKELIDAYVEAWSEFQRD